MTERIDLDELRKLADAATPGPWEAGDVWVYTKPIYSDDNRLSDVLGMKFADEDRASSEHARGLRNAEVIAAARTAVPELLDRLAAAEAKLAAVEALHQPVAMVPGVEETLVCDGCDNPGRFVYWPCPTVVALGLPVGGENDDA